jgi:hypothetical protein
VSNLLRRRIKREHLIVLSVFVIGLIFYLWVQTLYPLVYGIDGPYYLIQVRSLLETGHLVYGDNPLPFMFFTFFTIIFGDATLGIKFGASLFGALSSVPVYFWVKKITHSQLSGVVAMLVCIFSELHLRLLNDLLKNAVGAFFLLCFAYYLHSSMAESASKKNLFLAAASMILTAASHVLDFGVALLLMIVYSTMALLAGVDRRRIAKNVGILTLTVLILGIAAISVFPSVWGNLYKGISFFQELIGGVESGTSMQFLFDPVSVVFIAAILGVGCALSFYEFRSQRKEALLAVSSITITGTLLSLPFIPVEWLWRFLLMDFIPISFILGYSVSKIQTIHENRRKTAFSVLLFLCLSLLILQAFQSTRVMGPSVQKTEYDELKSLEAIIPSKTVVIGDLRYGYWLQYITRCGISSGQSADLWQHYEHVVFLVDKSSPIRPPAPPNSTIIYRGDRFVLYEQSHS